MTLTTSGGSACTSSKGVSKILESTFIITTSSRPFSSTLYVGGWYGGHSSESGDPWRARGSGDAEGGKLRPSLPSMAAPTDLCETGVDSDEVGHGSAADEPREQGHAGAMPWPPGPQALPLPRPAPPSPAVVQQVRWQGGDQHVLPLHGVQEGTGRVDTRGQLGTGGYCGCRAWARSFKNSL